jgi:hypothetical protein
VDALGSEIFERLFSALFGNWGFCEEPPFLMAVAVSGPFYGLVTGWALVRLLKNARHQRGGTGPALLSEMSVPCASVKVGIPGE